MVTSMFRFAPVLLLLSSLAAQPAPTTDQMLAALSSVRGLRQAAMSPDGSMAAWIETPPARNGNESRNSAIWVKEVASSAAPRRVSNCQCSENHPVWSHDNRLAFLSDIAAKGQPQLYVTGAKATGTPRKLTSLKGYLQEPRWSRDNRRIAVLSIAGATRVAGPTEAVAPQLGLVESAIDNQRLTLVDAQTGAAKAVSQPDKYVYEYDWSPDGQQIVYTAAPGPGDDNWFIAELYAMEAATGAVRHLHKPAAQIALPRWSPDGRSIAFIGGLMSDEGSTGGEIYVLPSAGGAVRDLTPGRKSSPSWFQWLPSGQRLLFSEHVAGETALATLDLASLGVERIWKGAESDDFSFSEDGTHSLAVRSSWTMPPEIWTGAPGHWNKITSVNPGLHPLWGEAESIEWQSDGFRVQGWLLKPLNYDPQRRYPMVVSVHGGPAAEERPAWPRRFFDLTVLSGQGYFVFFPNPRGSYGQGETFTKANVKDFGHGDLRDILSGLDAVTKRFPIDEHRIGLGGWSYGGYMTMWTVTQTNRFRAAVAGAGIANWQSYYGENSIDQWMIPYFGASVYDDPKVYAKSSPIEYIKQVKTPTLVVVGERDGECPAPQSFEFWHALKTHGVKTQLVVYPGEGHGFHDPEHIRDLMQRTVAWFAENMPADNMPAANE
jgi:dipeptidyl aminopeptidase/acylaminoacyl peptidase